MDFIENMKREISSLADGSYRYDDGSEPTAEERFQLIAGRCAAMVAYASDSTPAIVMGQWAGEMLIVETEFAQQALSQYQDFKAEQARNN